MTRSASAIFAVSALAAVLAACAGGTTGPLPGTKSASDVQTAGLSQTAVGKNKCDPKSANRPFVIEWDATDMSSFESPRVERRRLRQVRGGATCRSSTAATTTPSAARSARTSPSTGREAAPVESLDIKNEGDLYAKLPLGAASLGGRVEGGEKFHMEYFVSGTRSATRESVHRNDIARVAACKGATHFVYAYNLGAFALGSQSSIKGSVNATVWGFGGGADRSSSSKAEKAGGVLSSCRGDSAKDTATCRVPIRLTLREITDGDSAETAEAQAPETPEAKNLAGKLLARTDREHKAAEHAEAARMKASSRDGRGCLLAETRRARQARPAARGIVGDRGLGLLDHSGAVPDALRDSAPRARSCSGGPWRKELRREHGTRAGSTRARTRGRACELPGRIDVAARLSAEGPLLAAAGVLHDEADHRRVRRRVIRRRRSSSRP